MHNIGNFVAAGCFALGFTVVTAVAGDLPAEARRLNLSNSAALTWDKTLIVDPIFAPSLGAFLIQGQNGQTKFSGQVRKVRARGLATPPGVKREWADNLKALNRLEKSGHDLGCKKVGSGVFSCERSGLSSAGEFVRDRLLFNRNREIVHLRLSSKGSAQEIGRIAALFGVEAK